MFNQWYNLPTCLIIKIVLKVLCVKYIIRIIGMSREVHLFFNFSVIFLTIDRYKMNVSKVNGLYVKVFIDFSMY